MREEIFFLKDPVNAVQSSTGQVPNHTIYLTGDAGELNDQSKAVMSQLALLANDDTQPATILFLGDNVYPAGMPAESNADSYRHAQEILLNHVSRLPSFDGRIIFLPGNHDWNEFKPGGLDAIKRQGSFLRNLDDERISMLPENGCGGPVSISLSDEVFLIIIDSQWWLQDWNDEPDMNKDCATKSREELVQAVERLVKENASKQILIAMHHPLYTQGTHGGHFTVRDHLFPLSKVVKWLYLPLPVIGSIYPYYRSVIGHPQDIQHKNYTSLKKSILSKVADHENVIFLAGHDHNMQYITKGDDHFILSGACSKLNGIANTKDLVYGHKVAGLMQLDFYEGKDVRLTIFEIDKESNSLKTVFSRLIVGK